MIVSRIWYSLYTLHGIHPFPHRAGALLKLEFDQGIGYADCHPWESLGDLSLGKQLDALRTGKLTPLLSRSIYYANIDAIARSNSKHLFTNLKVPQSHWLFNGNFHDIPDGITHIKVKSHKTDLISFFKQIGSSYRIRIDCNAQYNEDEFLYLWKNLEPWHLRIDFIEDPTPFQVEIWERLNQSIPIAYDFDSKPNTPYVTVVKPAVQDHEIFERNPSRLVITSYLDHPIGQLSAAYTAATMNHQLDHCGLLSHIVYQPNEWSERLTIHDARLEPSLLGTGFGYDDLLKKQKWTQIK